MGVQTALRYLVPRVPLHRVFNKQLRVLFGFLAFSCFIYVFIARRNVNPGDQWYEQVVPCQLPESTQNDMRKLYSILESVFTHHGIPSFACYGTLFGAMRNGQLLPWDRDIDICAVYDKFGVKEFAAFRDTLRELHGKETSSVYDDEEQRLYVMLRKGMSQVTFFKLTPDKSYYQEARLREDGVMTSDLSFPADFVKDLTTGRIGDLKVRMPSTDLQKYHYPNSWWKVVKPPNC